MSVSSRQEARLLTTDEADLVAQSHRPTLDGLDDAALAQLVARLRERRDRARGLSRRQRRELRGKAAPSGTRPATDNAGTREKAALLAAAVKRANKEGARRQSTKARGGLVSNARRALAMKRAAQRPAANRPFSRTPGKGMHPVPNTDLAPSGALDSQGQEVAMRRGGGPR